MKRETKRTIIARSIFGIILFLIMSSGAMAEHGFYDGLLVFLPWLKLIGFLVVVLVLMFFSVWFLLVWPYLPKDAPEYRESKLKSSNTGVKVSNSESLVDPMYGTAGVTDESAGRLFVDPRSS